MSEEESKESFLVDWLREHGPVTKVCLMGSDNTYAWVSVSVLRDDLEDGE